MLILYIKCGKLYLISSFHVSLAVSEIVANQDAEIVRCELDKRSTGISISQFSDDYYVRTLELTSPDLAYQMIRLVNKSWVLTYPHRTSFIFPPYPARFVLSPPFTHWTTSWVKLGVSRDSSCTFYFVLLIAWLEVRLIPLDVYFVHAVRRLPRGQTNLRTNMLRGVISICNAQRESWLTHLIVDLNGRLFVP